MTRARAGAKTSNANKPRVVGARSAVVAKRRMRKTLFTGGFVRPVFADCLVSEHQSATLADLNHASDGMK